jgi:predicted nucleotidyltransferase
MMISSKDTLAGLPILRVRNILKRLSTGPFQQETLGLYQFTADEAKQFLDALGERKYVERIPIDPEHPDRTQSWQLTDLGCEFGRSTAAPRIKRASAAKALEGLLARVTEINQDPEFLLQVTHVVVFGSYLRDAETLGDLDVAVRTDAKTEITDEIRHAHLIKAVDSGRRFSSLFEELVWPNHQVNLKLKNGSRSIALQPWEAFERLVKKEKVPLKVVFGEPSTVFAK